MASVNRFEDFEVWKKARLNSKRIYDLTCKGSFARDYSLKGQINASSGSVMDNIAEGFERGGNKEFILFLSYSKGSTGEVRSQLFRAFDRTHIDEATCKELVEGYEAIAKMLSSLMSYLQNNNFRGSKFHEPDSTYELPSQNPEQP